MAEVLFYHLTRTPLEQTLPDLLEKSARKGWRVLVRGTDKTRLSRLDDRIWAYRDDSFVPHGLAGGAHDAAQPVLLTDQPDNANQADVLMLVEGGRTDAAEAQGFTRVCLLFDGSDAQALASARADWTELTAAGLPAKYWAQEGDGWVQKASKNCDSVE
jgi:DNA polymerase III subunit chi